MVEALAREKGISLHFSPCQVPCQVLADPTRLTQVIVNLLSNAIKYNRPGGIGHGDLPGGARAAGALQRARHGPRPDA